VTYHVIPIINVGESCNVSDYWLRAIWYKMVEDGKEKWVFYDGSVTNENEWLDFIKAPYNYPVIVRNDDTTSGCIAWLNHYENKSARGHYCGLGVYHRGVGQAVMNYWKNLKSADGEPVLLTILGITPETNKPACRMLKVLGFTLLGVIPNFCKMKYDSDRLVGGVVSYCCPQGG
jgi:hypothetical protein